VDCWKRLSDGDIHVDTSKNSGTEDFEILRYKANRIGDGWSYGRCVLALRSIVMPSSALAATLPLEDGKYTRGKCDGRSDILESIDVYTFSAGPQNGRRFLSPLGEDQDGACVIGKIDASGTKFSGSAECQGGGSRIQYSTGTYRFTYEILNNRTFISKGRKYHWCAP
jgi:hypothetical protein